MEGRKKGGKLKGWKEWKEGIFEEGRKEGRRKS
jgi:hypothetical protein